MLQLINNNRANKLSAGGRILFCCYLGSNVSLEHINIYKKFINWSR